MSMSILDDTSLDERAGAIVVAAHARLPSEASLRAAMMVLDEPWPAVLEAAARWIEIVDELAAAGLEPEQVLRVGLRACTRAYETHGPGPEILERLFVEASSVGVARALCEALLEKEEAPGMQLRDAASVALANMSAAGAFEPRFERLFVLFAPTSVLRTTLEPLPIERREALVLAGAEPRNPRNACAILDALLSVRDLVDSPAVGAAMARALEVGRSDGEASRLEQELAGTRARRVMTRPTERARESLEYWLEQRAQTRRAAAIGPLAERVWAERALRVGAPELGSMAAWTEAGDARRLAIAEAVVRAVGEGFVLDGIERFGDHPIAVLARGEERFCLVPGGTVEMGFSPEEEAAVRAASELNADCENHYELYESLFDNLSSMRPLVRVHVGPLLASQGPGTVFEPAEATAELERSPFRLPSEAEWEYLARGGQPRELTYRGSEVPDDEDWFEETRDLGPKGANPFGLWGFGFRPEVCADVYHPTHEGAAADGSPRRGEGPRVVRGGAAQLYPWQATGEWQLLLSAMRSDHEVWKYGCALRPVIGIRTT
jgi:sulfatase-modifying factor enzyme 1